MSIAVEILGHKKISYLDDSFRVDDNTTEDTALGFHILWQQFFHVFGSSIYIIFVFFDAARRAAKEEVR